MCDCQSNGQSVRAVAVECPQCGVELCDLAIDMTAQLCGAVRAFSSAPAFVRPYKVRSLVSTRLEAITQTLRDCKDEKWGNSTLSMIQF